MRGRGWSQQAAFVLAPVMHGRRGMALPIVIVVLLVLGASFAGGVALMRGERALDEAGLSAVQAQVLAETGLQRLVGDRVALGLSSMPSDSTVDSLKVTVSNGYYWVISQPLRRAVGTTVPALYLLRSHAVVTRSGLAGAPPAEYTVTQMATFHVGNMSVKAAFVGINGISKAGASGDISGTDHCSVADGGSGIVKPGVIVPTSPGFSGHTNSVSGDPAILVQGENPETLANSLGYDWADIYAGTAFQANYISNNAGVGFPTQAWFNTHTNEFPIIFVQNGAAEFDLNVIGRGMLIVQGDLWLNGATSGWEGVVLVGGKLTSRGSNQMMGATVAGLNAQTGGAPAPNDVDTFSGTKDFLYNSCSVTKAMKGAGRLRVYSNTWSNSYKSY